MNMIPKFLKPQWGDEATGNRLAATNAFAIDPPLDLDPGFEEACRQSLQEPMQTPTERLREAMENIIIVLADEAKADKEAGDDLFRRAQEKHQASCDKLAEIEKIKQSCRALSEPATGIASSPKTTRKKAREIVA